ncbi:MAG: tRNA pseudouridine(55) synthase TruB [Robiginitomaculum sp.]|nr:tRNA pseudouridine(55) synthase TruB [Robiginitomaculum sp.]MDQ7078709.1 tRNA pseudouridine(55) synthase TruB [Robiginitomaculum sp.]
MGRTRKKGQNITGWLVLDKPLGMTSTQALGKARWLLDAKKAGHAGTLDPLASGVLPLAFGEATKTINFMMDASKIYEFTVQWGCATTTLDAEGEVCATSDMRPDRAAIEAVLGRFIGDIEQMPPAFSAIKVDGKRAYDLARAGEEVVLKSRRVRIDALRLTDMPDADHAAFTVECGKGTYVRSLMRDIAAALGTQGHVVRLRRTRVGPFDAAEAIGLALLEERVRQGDTQALLQPLHSALGDLVHVSLGLDQAYDIRHGRAVLLGPAQHQAIMAHDAPDHAPIYAHLDQEPIAIGRQEGDAFKPVRVFNAATGSS